MVVVKDKTVLDTAWELHREAEKRLDEMRVALCHEFAIARQKKNLSFGEAAELIGCDRSNLSKFEKGRWSMKLAKKAYKVYSK
jgi:predicted transcriptional regulator